MTVELIVGSTGAGKTTYARKRSLEFSAAVFSIDDWMHALYWQDMPESPDAKWFFENAEWYRGRIERCEALILKLVIGRSLRGERSLLDLGFTTREHRLRVAEALRGAGASVSIVFLDVPAEVRWERVQKRNAEQGETYVMQVDRGMFDFMESIFEPPGPDERAQKV